MADKKTTFRYDINALRAIAVLAVIGFHYRVPGFTGGFAGVDIFFVISGFLMTRIVVRGMDTGTFSFADFYTNRVKRIVPALLVLIVVITLLCFFIYLPGDYKEIQKNALSSLLFYSNILYWRHSNYFDPASDANILLHTWSLSVEWQFYLLYPIALYIFINLFKNRKTYILFHILLTTLIFVVSVLITFKSPVLAFYMLPTRCWEMLFGGIIFFLEGWVPAFKWKKAMALVAYATICGCVFLFKSSLKWPGIFTLLPVVATGLVIFSNMNDWYLLKTKAIQFIGRISYSLYLWHWPVFVLAQYLQIADSTMMLIVLVLITFGLSYLSYAFVESGEYRSSVPIYVAAAVVALLSFTLGMRNSNNMMFDQKTLTIAGYAEQHLKDTEEQYNLGCCYVNSSNKGLIDFNRDSCLKFVAGKKNVLLLGDSHAAQYSGSFRRQFAAKGIHLLQANASGCVPLLTKNGVLRCSEVMDYMYKDFIVHHARQIDGLMISANWMNCYEDDPETLLSQLQLTISYIKKQGIPVVIIGQNESFLLPYPTIAAKDFQYHNNSISRALDLRSYAMNSLLKRHLGSYYIDIINHETLPGLDKDLTPYMLDKNHLTRYGADLASRKILASPLMMGFLR